MCREEDIRDESYVAQYSGGVAMEEDSPHFRQLQQATEQARLAIGTEYRHLIAHSPDGIFTADANGRFLAVNKAMCEQLKYDETELLTMTIWDVLPAEEAESLRDRLAQVLAGQDPGLPFEYVARGKDGRDQWVEVRACSCPLPGNRPGVQAIARDITERKRAEALLRMSESKLSAALEMAHLGYWEYDVARDVFTFNDHFYAMFHTTVEQVGGYTMSADSYAQRFVHPDDQHLVRRRIQNAFDNTEPEYCSQFDHRIIFADGGTGYISVRAFVLKDGQGRTIKTYGVNQDITERKLAEEALLQSEERYRAMFETTGAAAALFDEQGTFNLVNKEFEHLSGYSRREVEGLLKWSVFVCDKDRDRLSELHAQRLQGSGDVTAHCEFGFVTRSGGVRAVFLTMNLIPGTSDCVCALLDVTEQKKTSDLLVQRSREMEALVRSLDDIVFEVDEHGSYLNVWTSDESLLVKPRSEIIGKTIPEILGNMGDQILESITRVLETGQRDTMEYPADVRGEKKWFSAVVNRVSGGSAGRPTASVLVRDVTDRKKAERELRRLEEQHQSLIEAERDVIFGVSPEGYLVNANPAFETMTGWQVGEWVGRPFIEILRPEDRESARELLAQALECGMSGSRECHVVTKSGNEVLVEVTWAPQFADGMISRVLGIARDITERKQTEDQVQLLLRDKESLVREVQHRVVNNLQVISSLLNIEMTRLHAEDDARIFRQMQNRIKTMAVVHDAVINADRLSQLDFGTSIRQLCEHLLRFYEAGSVEVVFMLEERRLTLEQAVPSALIIYELLSNALRHAFPEGRRGTITIVFQTLHEEEYVLSVADDGVGYNDDPETRGVTATIGLKLVNILVDQIGGSLMTENKNGTRHTIVFPRRPVEA
jgi:PAS domain S-box-containing protein